MCILSIEHFHDMSEAPDYLNEKIIRYAKQFMNILKEVYKCERVYLCSMCDGLNNHYHVQLIPRYSFEKRGSTNFVKERKTKRIEFLILPFIRLFHFVFLLLLCLYSPIAFFPPILILVSLSLHPFPHSSSFSPIQLCPLHLSLSDEPHPLSLIKKKENKKLCCSGNQ